MIRTLKQALPSKTMALKTLLALILFITTLFVGNGWTQAQAQNQSSLPISTSAVIENMVIENFDRVAYRGDVDLRPALDRIERGERDSHRNDGSTFGNRERILPIMNDRNYYTEYVVRTPNISGVGPQRLVLGKNGEIYYTPDHYESFIELRLNAQPTVFETPAIDAPLAAARPQLSTSESLTIRNLSIRDLDNKVAYQGDINLEPVFDRIEAGEFDDHRSDGTEYDNRDNILPKKPDGYYLMYVIRTPGMSGVGPQRLVVGENWESYYTPDFFKSFIDVTNATAGGIIIPDAVATEEQAAVAPSLEGLTIKNVVILDDKDEVLYSGDMDLAPSLRRIAAGESDSYRSDGGNFSNREGLLPVKEASDYYSMFVVRTPNFDGVGPQRLVIGNEGEVYYTPDHFESFIHLNPEN